MKAGHFTYLTLAFLLSTSLLVACGGGDGDDEVVPDKPGAPTNVSATAGDGQVSISWNAVAGATSYNLYWAISAGVTKSNGTKIPGITQTTYTHSSLNNDTTYYYVVTAVGAGGQSNDSSEVNAKPASEGEGEPYSADGTWSYDAGTGVLTLNIINSDFECDGPEKGIDQLTVISITSTSMTWEVGEGDQLLFTRDSGSSGDIVGTWASTTESGNTYEATFNSDSTFTFFGYIVECGEEGEGASAHSQHWPEGYYVQLYYPDPDQTATSVTVTGPWITGSLSLAYSSDEGKWTSWTPPSNPVDFGSTHPAPSLEYTFTVTDASETQTFTDSVSCFVEEFATNLSPSGTVSGTPTFSWTGVGQTNVEYQVQLSDSSGRVWDSPEVTGTSVVYSGPALTQGGSYYYDVVVSKINGNCESFARESFTFGEGGGDGEAGAVSLHFPEGYKVMMFYSDPDQTATSVTVTGPGITGSLSLAYSGDYRAWTSFTSPANSVDFGSTYPAPPLEYTFTVTDSSGIQTFTDSVSCFVEEFATNLSPSGTVSNISTFSWTGVGQTNVVYQVRLGDSSGEVWDSLRGTGTSVVYSGPALTQGETYYYDVYVIKNSGDCQSIARESFTFGEAVQYTASGTYTHDSGTGLLTANWTSSDFECAGPSAGGTDEWTVLSVTATTMEWEDDGETFVWTRDSGTAGDMMGTWSATDDESENSYEITINSDLTFTFIGYIVECEGDETEAYEVWTGISRNMAVSGTTEGMVLHLHVWAPEGTVTQVELSGPSLPAPVSLTSEMTEEEDGVIVDDFSEDIPVTIDPQVGDTYTFTVTKADSSTVTYTQTLSEVILDAPFITSPAGYALADAMLGQQLDVTWTMPAGISSSAIYFAGDVCNETGCTEVEGTVTSTTSGYITLPDLSGAASATIRLNIHHSGEVRMTCDYHFQ